MDKPKTMEKQTTLKYVTRIDPITGIQSNPEDKRKVFISYKRDDGESIRNLITNKIIGLEDVAVWFDEKGLHSGEEYDKEIISAISDCDALDLEILLWIQKGKKNADVAEILHTSESTVKYRIKRMLNRARLASRKELMTIMSAYLR